METKSSKAIEKVLAGAVKEAGQKGPFLGTYLQENYSSPTAALAAVLFELEGLRESAANYGGFDFDTLVAELTERLRSDE
jgi:hypothetical protein